MKETISFFRYIWLSLYLCISMLAQAQPSEELIESAENNQPQAQIELANHYLLDNNAKKAHFWLSKAAINGDSKAINQLGQFYESQGNVLNPLYLSENWYQIAIESGSTEAEEGYSRVLEALFNQQRAKQVSSIALLDTQIDQDISLSKATSTVQTETLPKKGFISIEIIIISSIVIIIICFVALKRRKRGQKHEKLAQLEKTLSIQNKKLKTLNQHLNKAHQQLKQHQQINQIQSGEQELALACALLGFKPNQLPNENEIKTRYKMLSRVYHPDTNGSDDEMKRLNMSVKLIITHLRKTTK